MVDHDAIEILSRLFKLLNDKNRLKILFTIGKDKKSVSEIVEETGLSQTLVSFHLRPLRESGILSAERKGAFIYYSLTEPTLIDILQSLAGVKIRDETGTEEKDYLFPPMRFMCYWIKKGKEV